MSRKLRPLATLATLAVISAGCSNASAGTDTRTANDTNHAKAVKFAECMRRNGVSGFPDPDASGKLTIDQVANGSKLDTSTPAFKQAMSACKDLESAGFTGGPRTPAQQSASLKFAQCIRENGVRDFPDPVNGEPLVDTNRIPSAAEPGGMSILNAAMRKCRGVAAAAGVQP